MSALRTADELVERAVAETGLADLGTTAWRDGLEAVLASAAAEADLNDIGRRILHGWVHERLTNRLRVIDHVVHHPEVREERVERPLVVAGMLRTGTTILLELLAQDPANRPLMKWEGLDSVPPPEAATFATDPRIDRWVARMESTYAMVPALKAVHWEPGDGPTECVALLGQSFRSQDWLGLFHLPSYVEWYLGCDFTPAYDYHRLALQLLQSKAPGRWVLKAPAHLLALDELCATYPDARVVVTHRDPRRTVASSVSLSTTSIPDSLTETLTTGGWWGHLWMRMLGEMVDRLGAFRERRPEVDVYDLHYHDLVADPVGAVAGIYDHFGETLSAEAESAMRTYLADHPQGRHGRHRYTLDDAGLTVAEVDERFARYRAQFGVIPEDEERAV
jgi:hypothetical protein